MLSHYNVDYFYLNYEKQLNSQNMTLFWEILDRNSQMNKQISKPLQFYPASKYLGTLSVNSLTELLHDMLKNWCITIKWHKSILEK